MPPESAAPPAAPVPPRTRPGILDLLLMFTNLGTVDCRCGAPECPGTLARAAAPPVDSVRIRLLEKRIEFQREVARLINRLSLESHFGNRPDFDLARLTWDFLENPPLSTPVGAAGPVEPGTDVKVESKPETLKPPEVAGTRDLPPIGWRPINKPSLGDLLYPPPPETAKSEEPTREQHFIAMHRAAFKLGYRITDLTPFS